MELIWDFIDGAMIGAAAFAAVMLGIDLWVKVL